MRRFTLLIAASLFASLTHAAVPLQARFAPEPDYDGWSMTTFAPAGSEAELYEERLVLEDRDERAAVAATFISDEELPHRHVGLRVVLQVEPLGSRDAAKGNRFAFVRFGPGDEGESGAVRLIMPDSNDRVVIDVLSGEELIGPDDYSQRRFDLGSEIEIVAEIDHEAGTYDVSINGRSYATQAELFEVERAIGNVSVLTPSGGKAKILLRAVDVTTGELSKRSAERQREPVAAARETPSQALQQLMHDVDKEGGREVEVPRFDLQQADADWQFQPHLYYEHIKDEAGINAWRSVVEMPTIGRRLYTMGSFPIKPNTRYKVSALVKSDFERALAEVDIGVEALSQTFQPQPGARSVGLPAQTADDPEAVDGWVRWEYEFVTPPFDDPMRGRFFFRHHLGAVDAAAFDLRLAQLKLIELPASDFEIDGELEDLVQFRGGPGNLPMRVEDVEQDGDTFTIMTTGVKYTLDTASNTLTARQRIDFKRDLVDVDFSLPLDDLQIVRQDGTVAVLANDRVALGFQCDGMVAIAPRQELTATATAKIGGVFNRLGRGSLYAGDDFGGFTVNSYPLLGSGEPVEYQPVTPDLWFADLDRGDTDTLAPQGEASEPGWQVQWTVRPGERLFVSGFPCRPFDWEKSFNEHYLLSWITEPVDAYDSDWVRTHDVVILWDFHQREWGMAFSDDHLPRDPALTQAHQDAIREQGIGTMAYNSAWFHRSRDPEVWVESVRKQVEDEGFDGVYSDGLPAVEWLVGYEALRMLREGVLPDGPIRVHDSIPQSGRHTAEYAPFLYTYASTTYQAEHVETDAGAGWPWVRYVVGSWRQSNAIGDIKGDLWGGFGDTRDENLTQSRLAAFIWNGRPGSNAPHYLRDIWPVWQALEADWREHGDDPFYYDRYYLPKARELTGLRVGRAAMPIVEQQGKRLSVRTLSPNGTIHYTVDGSDPTVESPVADAPINLAADEVLKAVTIAPDLEPSAVATFPLPTD
jgi:hypothetical protein